MIDNKSWHLVDCVDMNAAHPDSFNIPSREAITRLKVGDHVQLIFELKDNTGGGPKGERMWVRITERLQNDFLGVLDSLPRMIEDLLHDQLVAFSSRDIVRIFDPNDETTMKLAHDNNNLLMAHEHCTGPIEE